MSQAFTLLEMAAKARTAEAKGERMAMLPFAPQKHKEGQAPDYREAWEYYHTPRAQHPNAPSVLPVHSLARLVGYDAFHLAEQLLPQPLWLIAGSRADRCCNRCSGIRSITSVRAMPTAIGIAFLPELLGNQRHA
jgi:uncharacterized protein